MRLDVSFFLQKIKFNNLSFIPEGQQDRPRKQGLIGSNKVTAPLCEVEEKAELKDNALFSTFLPSHLQSVNHD